MWGRNIFNAGWHERGVRGDLGSLKKGKLFLNGGAMKGHNIHIRCEAEGN